MDKFWCNKIADIVTTYLAKSPVPVISDVSPVHDLTKQVSQILPGHSVVSLKIIVEDIATDDKISSVERINLIPTLRTKLSPLSHYSMEVAEGEKNALELSLLRACL